MIQPDEILHHWFEVLTPEDWFSGGEEVDREIKGQFEGIWEKAAGGGCSNWRETAKGYQALTILLDQFPRNMFRGHAKSFWSDALARETADGAIASGYDLQLPERGRQFLYLPFMHSEEIDAQDRCVALYRDKLPETGAESLIHARVHREIIRRFGRFPYRNEALKRESTAEEAKWMADGGYPQLLEEVRRKT